MLSLMALNELGTGQLEPGLEHARAAFDIGQRTGDPDIQALGLVFQGFGLVHQGRLDEGRALLDEAMASATAGHLGTLAQGMVYCRTLSACLDTFDYRRAIEWTEMIERRAPVLGTVGFPGRLPDASGRRSSIDARRVGTRRRGSRGGRRRVASAYDFGPHGPGADRARRHPAATRVTLLRRATPSIGRPSSDCRPVRDPALAAPRRRRRRRRERRHRRRAPERRGRRADPGPLPSSRDRDCARQRRQGLGAAVEHRSRRHCCALPRPGSHRRGGRGPWRHGTG